MAMKILAKNSLDMNQMGPHLEVSLLQLTKNERKSENQNNGLERKNEMVSIANSNKNCITFNAYNITNAMSKC